MVKGKNFKKTTRNRKIYCPYCRKIMSKIQKDTTLRNYKSKTIIKFIQLAKTMHPEYQYLNLLKEILENWVEKDDRTWIWVKGLFGAQMRFDLSSGEFPLLTTKKTFLRWIIVELIWLIRWETNIKYLVDNNVHIWDEWPFQNWLENSNEVDPSKYPKYSEDWYKLKEEFIEKIKNLPEDDTWLITWWDLGPVYWHWWRNFWWWEVSNWWVKDIKKRQWWFPGGIRTLKKLWIKLTWTDQLSNAIDKILNKPNDRRMIVNAWNPQQLPMMLLPPCHMFYQFNVDTKNKKLNLQMYQRSADMFLWVPFNIASYSALLLIISKLTWLKAGEFVHTLWDVHIYKNHFKQVKTQLERQPYPWPKLEIKKDLKTLEDVENLKWEDFELIDYKSHDPIKAPVAV